MMRGIHKRRFALIITIIMVISLLSTAVTTYGMTSDTEPRDATNLKSGFNEITITKGKTEPTLYTMEMRENARKNIELYQWAVASRDLAVGYADDLVGMEGKLWEMITTQELPRSITVGYRWDVEAYSCAFCKQDLRAKFGQYPWMYDWKERPWKIQCPNCLNLFPSNDFEKFYQTGIDRNGEWNYELAKKNGVQYLYNTTFTKEQIKTVVGAQKWMDENWEGKIDVNEDRFKVYAGLPAEKVPYKWQTWGVDDGYGYRTNVFYDVPANYLGRPSLNGVKLLERTHTYIAYYNGWAIWGGWGSMDNENSFINIGLNALKDAYLFTGDPKYGQVGAILLDRFADVFPDLDTAPYFPQFAFSDASKSKGYALGSIWDCVLGDVLPKAYDAFYPMFDDPYVVEFLAKKASQYHMANPKNTPELIRKNAEDRICLEVFNGVKTARILGNFGMHQGALITAAVVLDSDIETQEMIDFVFRNGEWGADAIKGLNSTETIANQVDRDGGTYEISPHYSGLWTKGISNMVSSMMNYDGASGLDLYKNPKVIQAFKASFALTLLRMYTAQIGDSSYMGMREFKIELDDLIKAYLQTGDIEMGQMLWFLTKDNRQLLRKGIFDKNPEGLRDELKQLVSIHGEYDFDKSAMLPAYGFSILRSGSLHTPSGSKPFDSQRDFWVSFTKSGSHGHPDLLNLGMDQWGLNILPEFAYPIAADGSDDNLNWGYATVNHNTVMVNDNKQIATGTSGTPLHFDDSGWVKVMDISAPHAYAETDTYRRTVVMIDVDDQNSYAVDFFNVNGGNEHLYLMHANSNQVTYEGFIPVLQDSGTYAGEDVKYKTPGYSSGYTYLYNVKKAKNPGTGRFTVDYKIGNFRSYLVPIGEKHFRIEMLNDFNVSEITLADMQPPQRPGIPDKVDQLMVRNSGTNLSTLFTAVLEPYIDKRFITQSESVTVRRVDGKPNTENRDDVKAVKVTIGKRVDYVVYATNNEVEYVVDGVFNFKGFIGVYTLSDGKYSNSYLNDGTKIGDVESEIPAYTGHVLEFTRKFDLSNFMQVEFEQENFDLEALKGKFIYVENDGVENGVYRIEGAKLNLDGTVTVNLGYQTTIRIAKNISMDSADYTFNIARNQQFRIPIAIVDGEIPIRRAN